jgi:hypothetical protein
MSLYSAANGAMGFGLGFVGGMSVNFLGYVGAQSFTNKHFIATGGCIVANLVVDTVDDINQIVLDPKKTGASFYLGMRAGALASLVISTTACGIVSNARRLAPHEQLRKKLGWSFLKGTVAGGVAAGVGAAIGGSAAAIVAGGITAYKVAQWASSPPRENQTVVRQGRGLNFRGKG